MTSLDRPTAPSPLLLRSLLFVPGDSERKLAKAQHVAADALIIDLEDSVDAARKHIARELAVEFMQLRTAIRARTVWVRINAVGDACFADDVAAAVHARADGIVLPKPRSALDVRELAEHLAVLEARAERAAAATKILPIATETPASVSALGSYAGCGPRLAALTWGAEDLSAALGAEATVDARGNWLPPYELVRSLCLLAAGAAAVPAIDTVYTNVGDLEGLERVAVAARRDGFAGKLAIHPDQVEILNRVFRPTADAIAAARAIVAAFAAAGSAGVVSLDGRMLDRPHLLRARRVLATAAAADEPLERDAVND